MRYCAYVASLLRRPRIQSCILSFVIIVIIFSPLLQSGIPILWDLDYGFHGEDYLKRLFPVWNDIWKSNNFFNLFRILYIKPFHLLGQLFGNTFFVKSIFFATLWLTASSMIFLCYTVLRGLQFVKRSHAIFVYVCAGLLYALNIYAITRLSHIYLYIGYAIFPLTIAFLIRYFWFASFRIHSSDYKRLFFAGITTVVSGAAIHYIFYSFIALATLFVVNSLYYLLYRDSSFSLWNYLRGYIMYGCFTFALMSFFVVPYVGSLMVGTFSTGNLNTHDTIMMFSRFSDLWSVLFLDSYRWKMWSIAYQQYMGYAMIPLLCMIIVAIWLSWYRRFCIQIIIVILLIILSTGTYYPLIDRFYLWLVFSAPAAGAYGFIFRDPNKFIGILALRYGLWLWFALQQFFTCMMARSHLSWESLHHSHVLHFTKRYSKHLDSLKNRAIAVVVIGTSLCLWYAVIPHIHQSLTYLFNPVQAPSEYVNMNELLQPFHPKQVLYYPRYEKMITPGYQFTSTTWNTWSDGFYKPIGAVDLFGSRFPTIMPAEGNYTGVPFRYDFVSYYLKYGWWTVLGRIMWSAGFDIMLTHDDVYAFDGVMSHMMANLKKQWGVRKLLDYGFLSLRDIDHPFIQEQFVGKRIFQHGGMRSMITKLSYEHDFFSGFSNTVSQFCQQDAAISCVSTGEHIVSDVLDYTIHTASGVQTLALSDQIMNSDYRIWWAKNVSTSMDWIYQLERLGILNYPWSFDYSKWFAFTDSSASVEKSKLHRIHHYGKIIFDLSAVNDIRELFAEWNDGSDSNIVINLEKWSLDSYQTLIRWWIQQWDSPIRVVALMHSIPIKEKTLYSIRMQVSGKYAQKLHLKVKFLDENHKEIGIEYVSVPDFLSNYSQLDFVSTFSTPTNARFMQAQLSSMERPESKSYRWLHELVIKDLSDITIPNTIDYSFTLQTGERDVYLRALYNTRWWSLITKLDDSYIPIDTKSNSFTDFRRYHLGTLSGWWDNLKHHISIANQEWLNAVNVLALVPKKTHIINPSKQIISIEPELSAYISWHLQTYTHDMKFSNGRFIGFHSGFLTIPFSVLNTWIYTLSLMPNKWYTDRVRPQSLIISSSWNTVYTTSFDKKSVQSSVPLSAGNYTIDVRLSDVYNKSLINTYELEINTNEETRQLLIREDSSETEKRKKRFLVSQWSGDMIAFVDSGYVHYSFDRATGDEVILEDEKGCSYFEDLRDDDPYGFISGNLKYFSLKPGYSCFWKTISHDYAVVTGKNEYLIMFDIEKYTTKKFHSKIQFFDKDKSKIITTGLMTNEWLKTSNQLYNFEYEMSADNEQHHKSFQTIVTSPPGAAYMKIYFWMKQRQDTGSLIGIGNMVVKDFSKLPGVDYVILEQQSTGSKQMNSEYIMQFATPFSYFREPKQKAERFISNGMLNGYVWNNKPTQADATLDYVLHDYLKIWLSISWMSFVLFAGYVYMLMKKR